MKKLSAALLILMLPLLAACPEDRNGPGYAGQRVGYDVHADEYRHHSEDRGSRDNYDDDIDRTRDHNCPWHEQC